MKKLLMAFAILCSVSVLRAESDYYGVCMGPGPDSDGV